MATEALEQQIARLETEDARLRRAMATTNQEICQELGAALGYPRYCDDQKNFPGATETDGVCVGEHVAESIVAEAAKRITALEGLVRHCLRHNGEWDCGSRHMVPEQRQLYRHIIDRQRAEMENA